MRVGNRMYSGSRMKMLFVEKKSSMIVAYGG
jgi:hypothetical protein